MSAIATTRDDERSVIALKFRRRRSTSSFDLDDAFDRYSPSMLGFAVNALHDRALAEDCVQETFLRAWRARGSFDPARSSTRTWLFAIERNVITDVQRSIGRMPSIISDDVVGDAPDTRDAAAETVERLRVTEALAVLSPEHRQVVVAVHLAGSTYTELSASTGVPAATLRTRAYYALRALRTHFESQEDR